MGMCAATYLRHRPDAVAQGLGISRSDIDSIHQNTALRRVVETGQEVADGALAAAAAPHQTHHLSWIQCEVHAL